MKKTKELTKPSAQVKKGPAIESTKLKHSKDQNGNSLVLVERRDADDGLSSEEVYKNRLKEIVGVGDAELATYILRRGSNPLNSSLADQKENIVLQSLNNLKPKDVIEARLIVQETVLFNEVTKALGILSDAENAWEAEIRINLANKLAKLHNETIETLSRYRRGGAQTVNVQHNIVADNRSVMNTFIGVGGKTGNQGVNPCLENAEQNLEPMAIDHVNNQQWQTGAVDCMVVNARVPGLKKADEN